MEKQDVAGHLEDQVRMEDKDHLDYLVKWAREDEMENLEGQDHQAKMENEALDHKDLKDQLDQGDHPAYREQTEIKVLTVNQENRAQKEDQDMMVEKAMMDVLDRYI